MDEDQRKLWSSTDLLMISMNRKVGITAPFVIILVVAAATAAAVETMVILVFYQ